MTGYTGEAKPTEQTQLNHAEESQGDKVVMVAFTLFRAFVVQHVLDGKGMNIVHVLKDSGVLLLQAFQP